MIRRLDVMVFVLAGALSPTVRGRVFLHGEGELACDAALGADAVFLGRVVSTEAQRTVFAVVEAFRNVRQPQVTLANSGSSCDYTFHRASRTSSTRAATRTASSLRASADARERWRSPTTIWPFYGRSQ